MTQKTQWLQFDWGGMDYAVPVEDVSGIIRRERFRRIEARSAILIKSLPLDFMEKKEKWVIILRNHAIQIALIADRIIGERWLTTSEDPENETKIGFFRIRQF
jgi:hypothetical protein